MKLEEFAEAIKESRELVKSGKYITCPCTQTQCEWHGNCFECVMIHRTKKRHLPECLQPIIRERIKELAKTAELGMTDERPTNIHWDYLQRVAPPDKETSDA